MTGPLKFSLTVPGKIILMGEHSVLYKKMGIATAIDIRTRLDFSENTSQFTVVLVDLHSDHSWDCEFIMKAVRADKPLTMGKELFSLGEPQLLDHDKFLVFIRELIPSDLRQQVASALSGILYLVSAMFWSVGISDEIRPFEIVLTSELSMGAGTGSSAAFSVAAASAIYHYVKLKALEKFGAGKHNISAHGFAPCFFELSPDYSEFSKEDKNVINKWAYCVEKIMHGKPSGLDNTVCTFGGAVIINGKETNSEVPNFELADSLPTLRILLVNTNVARNTADLVKRVADLHALCTTAMDSVLNAMDSVAKEFIRVLQELKNCETVKYEKNDCLYSQLEGLIDIQHGLLTTIGVSHTRLDEICQLGRTHDLHFKLTGAGGGGFAFALVPPQKKKEAVDCCLSDFETNGFHMQEVVINSKGLELVEP